MDISIGSVCSGIEACSVALNSIGFSVKWLSEIGKFQSLILKNRYPNIPNLGDMKQIPEKILSDQVHFTDIICGGTPCQAFSLAGSKQGLSDSRGNLTLKFIDIIEANDKKRKEHGLDRCIVLWENVEGVLTDKTNAFGCFVSSLAGIDQTLSQKKWPMYGIIRGSNRNIAWRVLNANYFGIPQQRRRLYVISTDKHFYPETILFESKSIFKKHGDYSDLKFIKDNHVYEVFRQYTDCLYSSYGTKWNGNAAATNGSLFIVQDGRIRRYSPLECERLMGFPDNYTNIKEAKKTNRYQAIGNSWAIPVIKWIGLRIQNENYSKTLLPDNNELLMSKDGFIKNLENIYNCTDKPNNYHIGSLYNIVDPNAPEDIYLSPVGCHGIIRRKEERGVTINKRLEEILIKTSNQLPEDVIEKISLVQKRGRFSQSIPIHKSNNQSSLLDL